MKKLFLITFIFVSFGPCLYAPEGEPVGEWKPAQEPKSMQEATAQKTEAEQELKVAEAEKEKAQGDEQREKESELAINRAKLNLSNANIAQAEFGLRDVAPGSEKQKSLQQQLQDAQINQRAIETRLSGLSQELGESFRASQEVTAQARQWTDFYDSLKQDFENTSGKKDGFLRGRVYKIKKAFVDSPESQVEALRQIYSLAKENGITIKGLQERILELDEYLKNKNPKPVLNNELARTLMLDKKILPEDQIAALKKAVNEDPDNVNTLEQAESAMQFYGLDKTYPNDFRALQDMVKEKKEDQADRQADQNDEQDLEPDTPTIFETALSGGTALMGKLYEGGKIAANVTSEFVAFTAKDVKYGVSNAVEQAPSVAKDLAEGLQQTGKTMKDYAEYAQTTAQSMKDAPEITASLTYAAKETVSMVDKHGKKVKMIPGKTAEEAVKYMKTAKEGAKTVTDNSSMIKDLANALAEKAAPVVSSAAKVGEWVGGKVQNVGESLGAFVDKTVVAVQEQGKSGQDTLAQDFETAQIRIANERNNIALAAEPESNPWYTKFKNSFSRLTTSVRDWFTKNNGDYGVKIDAASGKYTDTRTAYLKKLGFSDADIANTKNPITADRIKTKLQDVNASGNKKLQKELEALTKKLADNTSDIARQYSDYAQKMDTPFVLYDFAVKMWDDVGVQVQPTISGTVNELLTARNMRVGYLDALKNSAENLKQASSAVKKNRLQEKSVDAIVDMLDASREQTLKEYQTMFDQMGVRLKQAQDKLQKMPKNNTGQAQNPPVMPGGM